ncbi:MAG: hypothetical protein ACRD19_12660 [Terriglobia bacterium]
MTDQELIERATRTLYQTCKAKGMFFYHPANGFSRVENGRVILANVNGTLAEYEIRGDPSEVRKHRHLLRAVESQGAHG